MPNRIGPSVPGARAAKELLLRISRANARAIAATGEIDPEETAKMIEAALEDASFRRGMLLALAEVIALSVEGAPIDPSCWTPLKYYTTAERDENTFAPPSLKRPF